MRAGRDTRRYWDAVRVRERLLDLVKGDEGLVLEVVCKGEGLDVLLEAGRDLAVVPPEAIACELVLEGSVEILDLAELLDDVGCSGVEVRVGWDDAVEEEDGALGEIGGIAAGL